VTSPEEHHALLAASRALLLPLARLLVARGVPYAQAEESLKTAMVQAAQEAHPDGLPHRLVSRIATITGINRREVTRLTRLEDTPHAEPQRSAASQTFSRWRANPDYLDAQGKPLPLRRQGDAPSFESLARGVTPDVHPRSLLDELCRLGLARIDGDTVHLVRDSFVPSDDSERMLGFLGTNVGDHLRGAVANVLSQQPPHLEQAIFADELSHESLAAFGQLMRAQWKTLLAATVPALQQLIDADQASDRIRDQRVRVGLYTYHDTMPPASDKPPTPAPGKKRAGAPKRRRTP
jgi:hypothetical protein